MTEVSGVCHWGIALKIHTPMSKFSDIFTWKNWDDFGESKTFYDCVLLMDVGGYTNGNEFEYITFSDDTLTLKFYIDYSDTPVITKHLGIID